MRIYTGVLTFVSTVMLAVPLATAASPKSDICTLMGNMVAPAIQFRDAGVTQTTALQMTTEVAHTQGSHALAATVQQMVFQYVYQNPRMPAATLRTNVEAACRQSLPR